MKWKNRIIAVAILGLGVAGFMALKATKPEPQKVQAEERVWSVQTQPLVMGDFAPMQTLYATVQADKVQVLSAPMSGVIEKVGVQSGEWASENEEIIRMEAADFEIALLTQKANLAKAEADLTKLEKNYTISLKLLKKEKDLLSFQSQKEARLAKLHAKKLVSDDEYESAKEAVLRQNLSVLQREQTVAQLESDRMALKANIQQIQQSVRQSELMKKRSVKTAQEPTLVVETLAKSGEQVGANAALLKVLPVSSMEFHAILPNAQVAELAQALRSQQTIWAYTDLHGQPLKLRLKRILGSASAKGQTGVFVIDDIDADSIQSIRLGQLMTLRLNLPKASNVARIPYSALYGRNKVFFIEGGRLVSQQVDFVGENMGKEGAYSALVKHPELQSGQPLVVTHLPNALDGLKVKAQ